MKFQGARGLIRRLMTKQTIRRLSQLDTIPKVGRDICQFMLMRMELGKSSSRARADLLLNLARKMTLSLSESVLIDTAFFHWVENRLFPRWLTVCHSSPVCTVSPGYI